MISFGCRETQVPIRGATILRQEDRPVPVRIANRTGQEKASGVAWWLRKFGLHADWQRQNAPEFSGVFLGKIQMAVSVVARYADALIAVAVRIEHDLNERGG